MNARILIVDDHEIVREGICNLLARSGKSWEVCGEASNANDAMVAIKSLRPDVVVLDVTMPGTSGLEAARLIGKLDVATRILIFTMHESPRIAVEVREAGAHGYVSKSQASRDLVLAIRSLLSGGTFFPVSSGQPTEPSGHSNQGTTFRVAFPWAKHLRPRSS
jgi:DNA-binding NarL/FixJ family response regulator